MRRRGVLAAGLVILSTQAAPMAQQPADGDTATTIGGVTLTRAIQFKSGVDTNVFNSPDHPVSDFTWTLTPKAAGELRLGPARVGMSSSAAFVYYRQSATERSINTQNTIRITVPINRVRPYVFGTFLRTRQRLNYDIDARALRQEYSAGAGAEIEFSPRASVGLSASSGSVDFARNNPSSADFRVLNRRTDDVRATARYGLTPLTSATVDVETTRERFPFSPLRYSRSLRIAPALEFASTAIFNGRASVGYRTFTSSDASVPGFTGAVASVDLTYAMRPSTRLLFNVNRDIDYSYDPTAPYFVLMGAGVGGSQQVTDNVAVTARVTRFQLAYQSLAGVENVDRRLPDTLMMSGGGLLYRIRRDLRLDLNVDYYRRFSHWDSRNYNGLQVASTLLFGF